MKALQQFLNAQGFTIAKTGPGSLGQETSLFGPATKAALIKFQEYYAADILYPNSLTRGTGVLDPATIQKIGEVGKK